MTAVAALIAVLALASWLALSPPGSAGRRVLKVLPGNPARTAPDPAEPPAGRRQFLAKRTRGAAPYVPMTVVVQQLAALLKGGRVPARLWDELWLLYIGDAAFRRLADEGRGIRLAPASVAMLTAARAAALAGSPVAEAIRSAGTAALSAGSGTGAVSRELKVWGELAACFDIAEATGCPLADVLTRFAAHLEAEDDAEAARQTALAGPRATVKLLTWLPLLGLGLGMLLGVDPVKMLLGTPFGMTALAAGIVFTTAGRIWSARLVRAAAGPP